LKIWIRMMRELAGSVDWKMMAGKKFEGGQAVEGSRVLSIFFRTRRSGTAPELSAARQQTGVVIGAALPKNNQSFL